MQVRFCVGEQEQNFTEVERTRKGIAELRKKNEQDEQLPQFSWPQ